LTPLAELPAVLRQGEEYVHVTCWTGEEPVERPTAKERNETAERMGAAGRLSTHARKYDDV
jgi:hypothetical protein